MVNVLVEIDGDCRPYHYLSTESVSWEPSSQSESTEYLMAIWTTLMLFYYWFTQVSSLSFRLTWIAAKISFYVCVLMKEATFNFLSIYCKDTEIVTLDCPF